jgi:nucleoid-associated protein YgaU
MPNDAKLGLALGVGLVVLVGAFFLSKDPRRGEPTPSITAPHRPEWGGANTPSALGSPGGPAYASFGGTPRQHTVREGETLFSVALQYYGDGAKSSAIFQLNRDKLLAPDRVPAGTVLVLPDPGR